MVSEWHKVEGMIKPKQRKFNQRLIVPVSEDDKESYYNCLIDRYLELFKSGLGVGMIWKSLGLYDYDPVTKAIKSHPRYKSEVLPLIDNRLRERRKGF